MTPEQPNGHGWRTWVFGRAAPTVRRWRIPLLVGLAVVGLVLGWIGFDQYFRDAGRPQPWLDNLYYALGLFAFEGGRVDGAVPWPLQVARFMTPLVVFAAAVGAFVAVFDQEVQRLRARFALRDHVVVVGLGNQSLELGLGLVADGHRCVLVELAAEEHPNVHDARRAGIPVVSTGATNPELLSRTAIADTLLQARIDRANAVIVTSDSPRVNARIANAVRSLQSEGMAPRAQVEIDDAFTLGALQVHPTGDHTPMIEYFSVAERGGKALLDALDQLVTIRDAHDTDQHLVIVGCSELGWNTTVQAVRNWAWDLARLSLPDHGIPDGDARPRITLVDTTGDHDADDLAVLRQWEPRLGDETDARGGAVAILHDRAPFARLRQRIDQHPATVVVVTDDDEHVVLRHGLSLREVLPASVPVWLCTDRADGLVDLAARGTSSEGASLAVFRTHPKVLRYDEILRGADEEIAIALHQNYRRFRDRTTAGSVAWADLDERYRTLNRVIVPAWRQVLAEQGRRVVPYRDLGAELQPLPESLVDPLARSYHATWCAARSERTSWPEPHDNEVDWARLSEESRAFNRGQARALPLILAAAGLQLSETPLPS